MTLRTGQALNDLVRVLPHAEKNKESAAGQPSPSAGAPAHAIMAQRRFKTARIVEVYTQAVEADRAVRVIGLIWKVAGSTSL